MTIFPPALRNRLEVFSKKVGRGVHRFNMIENGERVLLGVSGGKDSLALAWGLSARLSRLPVRYSLEGLFINWVEHPVTDAAWQRLLTWFDSLAIPLRRADAHMFPPSFGGRFDCYLCSRNKRRILFNEAGRLGIRTIALGHHLDDIIETTLMNLFFHGEISTMMPVQEFFKGKLRIIRPLCEVKEKEVARAVKILGAPVFSADCPRKAVNRRIVIKEMVNKLAKTNKQVRENIFKAPWRIKKDYLPGEKF